MIMIKINIFIMIMMIINIHLGEGNAVHLLVQLVPEDVRRVLRRFIITLVAFVWFFSTVCFQLVPKNICRVLEKLSPHPSVSFPVVVLKNFNKNKRIQKKFQPPLTVRCS